MSCVPGEIPKRLSDSPGDLNAHALRLNCLKLVCLPFHQYRRWLLIACEVPVGGVKAGLQPASQMEGWQSGLLHLI